MSGFEAAGLVLGGIPLVLEVIDRYRRGLQTLNVFKRNGRLKYYEDLSAINISLVAFIPRSTLEVMERINDRVLSKNDDANIFKESFCSSLNMVAVAGAIIAQVAITGLSLDNIRDVHWTAAAFFITSLMCGILSVFFSCTVLQILNGLNDSKDLKDWLCSKFQSTEIPDIEARLEQAAALLTDLPSTLPLTERDVSIAFLVVQDFENLISRSRWARASLYSAMMLTAPTVLLELSLNCFTIGLGIYLGCIYTAKLIPPYGSKGSLGLLIFYLISTFWGLAIFYIPSMLKDSETIRIKHITKLMDKVRSAMPTRTSISLPTERPRIGRDNGQEMTAIPTESTGEDLRHGEPMFQRSSSDSNITEMLRRPSLRDHQPSGSQVAREVPLDPFRVALEALIRAQEETTRASKALLQSYSAR